MFTKPEDFIKFTTGYFNKFPKTADEVKIVTEKVKTVVATETQKAKDVIAAYSRLQNGDGSLNDLFSANKKAKDLLVTARFATVLALPGGIFMLPALIEASKEFGVDFVPESVAKEFNV